MKINKKVLCGLLCAALLAAFIPGCSSDEGADAPVKTDAEGNVITTADSDTATNAAEGSNITDGTQSPDSNSGDGTVTKSPEEIKSVYTPTSEESEKLDEENTEQPIIYSGFEAKFFSTPMVADPGGTTVIPVFSHAGLVQYIEDNKQYFDFGIGEGSFTDAIEDYQNSFFDGDKCILIVAFNDKDGGKDHKLMGGWEEHLHAGDVHLDQLVLAVKKSDGDITAGHMLVEIDKDFVGIWDAHAVSIYE